MSADTLYNFKEIEFLREFWMDPRNSPWSPEKAAEVLEDWLNELIREIENEEDTYFFSPNFIQLDNLKFNEVLLQHGAGLVVSCFAAIVVFGLLRFDNILLTILCFALINVAIFGSYTVAWGAIILYQALEVSRFF